MNASMNLPVFVVVMAYELISIFAIGLFLAAKARKAARAGAQAKDDFALAGRTMGMTMVGLTLALTVLGSAHIWGTTQNAYLLGGTAAWCGVAFVIGMGICTQGPGLIARRLGVATNPELFERLYGKHGRTLQSALQGGTVFGFLCMETQCMAVTIQAMTGWAMFPCAVIGGVIGILYVVLAGMKEVGFLNLINAVVMYVGLAVALVCLIHNIPGGAGAIESQYASEGLSRLLSAWGNPNGIVSFAVPTMICVFFYYTWGQFLLQPALSASSERSLRRSQWVAGPVNGMFCVMPSIMGICAFGILKYRGLGDWLSTPAMLAELVPSWALMIMFAGFMGVLLSTFAIGAIAPGTIYAYDLYGRLGKPNATEQDKVKMMRLIMIILGIVAIFNCLMTVNIMKCMFWVWSMCMGPGFCIWVGMYWKRSRTAFYTTTFCGIAAASIWTFVIADAVTAKLPWMCTPYFTAVVVIIVGFISHAASKGKPGLVTQLKREGKYKFGRLRETAPKAE